MATRDQKQVADRIAVFLKKYGRKRHPNHDPNDRDYDREIELLIKRMDPTELDRLMREDN